MDAHWHTQEAQRSLRRLLPRLQAQLGQDADVFLQRLGAHFPTLFKLLHGLYGNRYDFFYHLEQVCLSAVAQYNARPQDLKALDREREQNPTWFKGAQMMGAMAYVDLFAGDLEGLRAKIPYLKELGITYLHLMPLFKAPEKDSDGGYAVSDYRTVNPALGTMAQLASLTQDFRREGVSLVLDFVFNHTSHEHEWAQKARAGDEEYRDYYYIFPDRTIPDQYERHLREIFPEQDPGNFTYLPQEKLWVWTTFRHFQWDLNYSNPAVFNAMLNELLFLANQGVEVLRLDAVAFLWKQMGTVCEGLPQAHEIIQAYNALVKVVAPAMVFKSEAIVHPDIVATYIGVHEAPISYNPTMMALLWEAIATRNVTLLSHSMQRRFALPSGCAWVNYVRCHDDIGWTFADEDAVEVGIYGFPHRQFLNSFYVGRFAGSFAKGVPFNYNPITQDMRISGTAASLIGLEQALERDDPLLLDHAIARLLLIHSVILSTEGIPLLYLGDEIAMLNDYGYQQDEAKRVDSRWVHRPAFDWARAEARHDPQSVVGRVFAGIARMIALRKRTPALSGSTRFFHTGSPHVLGYACGEAGEVVVLANFSESVQGVPYLGFAGNSAHDLLTDSVQTWGDMLALAPYQALWLRR
jgi:glycosidase